jgi:hypothetical protein
MCKEEKVGDAYSWILKDVCNEMEEWCTTTRDNLFQKQIERSRNDNIYRDKMTERLLKIAKKHLSDK